MFSHLWTVLVFSVSIYAGILSPDLSPGLRVVAEPVTVVLPDSHHTTSLMAPTGLLTSSWIHLLIIDTCISKHLVYLCCKMYYLFDVHTASIARLPVLGEGSLLCCSP